MSEVLIPKREYWISEIRQLPASCGIYAIVNVTNGHRYVGQALNIRERILTHVRDLTAGRERTNKDGLLQHAWNDFGRDNFVVRILEIIEDNRRATSYRIRPDNLNLAEHFYINEQSEYNRDKRIFASEFQTLIDTMAWRSEIDATARRVDWSSAVIVLALSSEDAKLLAASRDPTIEALGRNLSTRRLSGVAVLRELAIGAKDLRQSTLP